MSDKEILAVSDSESKKVRIFLRWQQGIRSFITLGFGESGAKNSINIRPFGPPFCLPSMLSSHPPPFQRLPP